MFVVPSSARLRRGHHRTSTSRRATTGRTETVALASAPKPKVIRAAAVDATTRPHRRRSWRRRLCLGILLVVCLVFGNEAMLLHVFGRSRDVSCPDGAERAGDRAQRVCLSETTVTKVPMPCATIWNVAALIDCKATYWRQLYVNHHWGTYAESSPLLPDVVGRDRRTGGVTFERIKPAKESARVIPDYEYNREQLRKFDDMLGRNGHVALDVRLATKLNKEPNVLLDDAGRMHIIDFNLMPAWLRGQGVDEHAERLTPLFDNIYGTRSLLDWVVEGGVKSDLAKRAPRGKEEGGDAGRRRLRGEGRLLRGGGAAAP